MAINIEVRVYHDTGDTSSNPAAAQAGCTATCRGYYSGTKTYTGGHPKPGESGGTTNVVFTNYQLTARPATASGWTFKGWDVLYNDYITGGLDEQGNVRTDVEIVAGSQYQSGPSPYPASTSAVDFQFPYDFEEANPGWDWTRHTFKREIIAIYAQFEQGTPPLPTYTITTAVTPEGAGTTTGGGTYNSGASCTLTATPASGYSFVRWEKNGTQVSTSASYTFTVSESAAYTAVFELAYTVSASSDPINGGTVQVGPDDPGTSSSYIVTSGNSITVVATPSSGYVFDGWYEGSARISTSASTTITNVTSNRSLVARFLQSYTIQAGRYSGRTPVPPEQEVCYVTLNGVRDDGGSLIAIASGDFPAGTQVTLSAIVTGVDPYLVFQNWLLLHPDDGWFTDRGTIIEGATITVTVKAEEYWRQRYRANFIDTRIVVYAHAQGGVTINGQGGDGDAYAIVPPGDTVTVSCGLSYGTYHVTRFVYWTESDNPDNIVSRDCPYVFTATENIDITAQYKECGNVLSSVAPDGSGTITYSRPSDSPPDNPGDHWYEEYSSVSLTAMPASGYRFAYWEIGSRKSYDATYTISSVPAYSSTFIAHFLSSSECLIKTESSNAYASLSGEGIYTIGSSCTITASVYESAVGLYEFDHWEKSGVVVSNDASYTFVVAEDATFVAVYRYCEYTVTTSASPSEGGTISPSGGVYHKGDYVTFRATANEGYVCYGLWINDVQKSQYGYYSISIRENLYVEARFRKLKYTITTSVSGSGTVTGGGQYEYGDTCVLTAIPSGGHSFHHWSDGDTSQTKEFTVTRDESFTAYFRAGYWITTSPSPEAWGTTTGDDIYKYGATVQLVATAKTGYRFCRWEKDGVTVSRNAKYTFTFTGNTAEHYTAYFEWDGTDLLVNSANLGSPVQLVYDPATNKLVADY